jgi:hypothetical protein
MPVDKILVSHVVSEVLIICGVTFYFHKKCARLQHQIDELNSKLEKLNANSYISSLKRQEQFEVQTVQQINKIYSILNNMNNLTNMNNLNNIENTSTNFKPVYNEPIRENYNNVQQELQTAPLNKPQAPQNTLLSGLSNGLSMLSSLPISTMFQVVMKDKPPHPDELFQNMDINKELNKNKIVEVEDDEEEVDSNKLDDELEDELNDLKSNITTAMNTPVLTPLLTPSQSNIASLNLCEDGVCKLDMNKLTKNENEEVNLNIPLNNIQISDSSDNEKSSPLRYISNIPQNKRGRPKKQ